MKKTVLFFLALLIFFHGYSQDPEDTKVDFGFKGGVNIGGIKGTYSNSIDAYYKISLHAGLFFSYPIIKEKLRFQGEMLFSGRGYKADVMDSIFESNITHNMFYLEFPLFAQIFISKGWEAHIGVQYSLLLFEEYVNFVNSRKSELSVSDNDLGILIGGAYRFDKKNQAGFRYVFGLKDILEYQGNTSSATTSSSSVFQIYVAYTIF